MRSLFQPFLSVQNLAKFGENFNNFFKFPKFEKKNQLKKNTYQISIHFQISNQQEIKMFSFSNFHISLLVIFG
jgi:hypothetical protein